MPSKSRKTTKRKDTKERTKSSGPYVVFVSHSSKDLWIAKTMAEKITALGAEVWLDEKDLEGGDVIIEKIIDGLEVCNEAIVLISPDSIKSEWVRFEVAGVRVLRKRLTPILNHIKPAQVASLRDVLAIELNNFEQLLDELKKRIEDFNIT
ncbi:toll/interleukin-1 receptor domain-containing protein [candidate division KSB1 bacterium]|nr:toll/interleukin-1 receptor domain-containing protein [candidate division KSB1 bacterium]